MSKILKSFGMAALLVALLAGTGMAANPVDVTGCYFPADYFELDAATLTDDLDLGVLPAVDEAGGSVDVRAGANWKLEVIDGDGSAGADIGKMVDGITTLANKFVVNDVALAGAGDGTKTVVKNDGTENADCDPQNVLIAYDQAVKEDAPADVAGDYSITLTFSVAART